MTAAPLYSPPDRPVPVRNIVYVCLGGAAMWLSGICTGMWLWGVVA